ncbi:uncharacterized protein RMCFA_2680 [Mycolicibacterium fortuitum subsp. acetamidolyticum]|uniref:Uncharacterized protein n=1 Tax=Mycolicibacterium fortuitum subsp. acetamidolyticum TaxID=144550 RepID=A0A100WQB4_MYCFO|nr:uncharacterized protein RMCFA_2680 [Mycolicibacterium fortuitum subsp. acetamidolyticum]
MFGFCVADEEVGCTCHESCDETLLYSWGDVCAWVHQYGLCAPPGADPDPGAPICGYACEESGQLSAELAYWYYVVGRHVRNDTRYV